MNSLRKSKKGDLMLDIISIFLMMIVYFNVVDPILAPLSLELLDLNPDSITGWFIRAISFLILLGILRYVLVIKETPGGI